MTDDFDASNFDYSQYMDDEEETCEYEDVTVYLKTGSKPKYLMQNKKKITFKSTQQISAVKQKYIDLEAPPKKNGDGYNDLEEVIFNGAKGIMQTDDLISKHVSSIGELMITITFKVEGGSKKNEEKDEEKIFENKEDIQDIPFFSSKNLYINQKKIRKLNKKKGLKYPLSKKIDIITLEKDPQNNVFMPCGHTFSPTSIFCLMLAAFINTRYNYSIKCPVPKCQKIWPYKLCKIFANLTKDEQREFELEIISRKTPSKICPNCNRRCSRPSDLRYYRVACICKKGDWCYECENKWKGGGFTVCGNKGKCHTNEINEILKNCKTENKYSQCNSMKVPSLRACPKCYAIIQHSRACKHMHCKDCGNRFCFVCLKSADIDSNGKLLKWNCKTGNSHSADCGVADIQTVK